MSSSQRHLHIVVFSIAILFFCWYDNMTVLFWSVIYIGLLSMFVAVAVLLISNGEVCTIYAEKLYFVKKWSLAQLKCHSIWTCNIN
jgi:hypothetical protein